MRLLSAQPQPMATVSSAGVLPKREDFVYASCYCEENAYLLCQRLIDTGTVQPQDLYVCLISNPDKAVALWQQRASTRPDGLVVWDYHVMCVERPAEGCGPTRVWDLDTQLPFPCAPAEYAERCLWHSVALRGQDPVLTRYMRVVPARDFLAHFSSDRRHMMKKVSDEASSHSLTCEDSSTSDSEQEEEDHLGSNPLHSLALHTTLPHALTRHTHAHHHGHHHTAHEQTSQAGHTGQQECESGVGEDWLTAPPPWPCIRGSLSPHPHTLPLFWTMGPNSNGHAADSSVHSTYTTTHSLPPSGDYLSPSDLLPSIALHGQSHGLSQLQGKDQGDNNTAESHREGAGLGRQGECEVVSVGKDGDAVVVGGCPTWLGRVYEEAEFVRDILGVKANTQQMWPF